MSEESVSPKPDPEKFGQSAPKRPTTNPNPPFRSMLAPYARQIAKWQRERKSYKEISALLKGRPGITETLHPDTICSFVLVRSRRPHKPARLPAEYLDQDGPVTVTCHTPNSAIQTPTQASPAPVKKTPPFQNVLIADPPRDVHGRPAAGNPVKDLSQL